MLLGEFRDWVGRRGMTGYGWVRRDIRLERVKGVLFGVSEGHRELSLSSDGIASDMEV